MRIISIAFEFQLHGAFQRDSLEKKIVLREHLKFLIVNSKEKGKPSKISLSKDLTGLKAHNKHCVSVLKPYFVLACLLIELH